MTSDDDDNSEARFRDKFASRLKDVSIEQLPAFINEMLAEPIDYGTICLAIGFAATAAAWAVEKSPQGGITGFQAGFVGWEFLRQWGSPSIGKLGARLLSYDDLLYPQYESRFNVISAETVEAVKAAAAEKLSENIDFVHTDVRAHWQSLVDGNVPFGLRVVS